MKSSTWGWILSWVIALGLLAGVLYFTVSLSDLKDFVTVAEHAKPIWIVAIIGLQILTYICAGLILRVMLKAAGKNPSLKMLVPLSIEKLTVDQFLPTAGVGGSAIVVKGLQRTGASRKVAIGTVMIGLAAWYFSGDLAGLVGLGVLHHNPIAFSGALAVYLIYTLVAAVIVTLILHATKSKLFDKIRKILPFQAVRSFFEEVADTHELGLLTSKRFAEIAALQLGIILLDAGTLAFAAMAVGHPISFTTAFAVYALANMAATISVLPGGIGVFEGGSVAILTLFGLTPASALAATLLYRGFSLWLPLIPGAFLVRRELRTKAG